MERRTQVYSKGLFKLFSLSYSLCLYHALGGVSQCSLLSIGVSWCGPCDSTCCWAGNSLIYDRIPASTLESTRIRWHSAHKSTWEAVMPNALHQLLSWCLCGCISKTAPPEHVLASLWAHHLSELWSNSRICSNFASRLLNFILHEHRRQLMYELILFPLALSHTWRQQVTEVLNAWIIQVPAQPAGNSSCLCWLCCFLLMFPLASTDFAIFFFFAQ